MYRVFLFGGLRKGCMHKKMHPNAWKVWRDEKGNQKRQLEERNTMSKRKQNNNGHQNTTYTQLLKCIVK
jgi:hypothetical protein